MRKQRLPGLTRNVAIGSWVLVLAAGCGPRTTPSDAPPDRRSSSAAAETAAPVAVPSVAWTRARAADPELVHLHLAAAAVPGAFLVPWLEGVTVHPCAVVVHERGTIVQDTRFGYDQAGRLITMTNDEHVERLRRDSGGRLVEGHGFHYVYDGDRLVRLTQGKGDDARIHTLRYDDDGSLVAIESARARDEIFRTHALRYDEHGLLVLRRWLQPDGARAQSDYTYDEVDRLVRVDLEWTDAEGNQRVEPALRMEYVGDRLVEFGRSMLAYDARGRVSTVVTDQGARAEYRYACR